MMDRWLMVLLVSAAVAVAGCRTDGAQRAVVVDASQSKSKPAPAATKKKARPASSDWRPKAHVVKKGDTLYSIAFNYGLDYRELAELNGIQNPSLIYIGQEIRLFPQAAKTEPAVKTAEAPAEAATVTPPPVEPPRKAPEILTKTTPKAVKLPYSEQALAQVEAMPDWNKPKVTAPVAVAQAVPESRTVAAEPAVSEAGASAKAAVKTPTPVIKPEAPKAVDAPKPDVQKSEPPKAVAKKAEAQEAESGDAGAEEEGGDDENVGWIAPTSGKVIGGYSESANRKGVDIAGKHGQPIYASAGGKVVYSGSGLRGYGKLIIIKHNKTYISAYAHNDKVLVKERQQVSKGDKIAEMGHTDSEQVKLHFEIRKFGKPIDPAKLLPPIQP